MLIILMCVNSGRVADFSDEDEEFSSNEEGEGEGSDFEPMLDERRSRKSKIPVNARVNMYFLHVWYFHYCLFKYKIIRFLFSPST